MREKKYKWARIYNPSFVQSDVLPQVKYTCVDLKKDKSSIFKKSSKHSLRSRYQNRERGASLNAQELTSEKKVVLGENLSPKHCPNR